MTLLVARPTVPGWLVLVAWSSIGIGVVCAALVAWDVARHPPAMRVMALVWPLTCSPGGSGTSGCADPMNALLIARGVKEAI